MKKLMVTCMILAGMATASYAQENRKADARKRLTAAEKAEKQTARMTAKLKLSDDQRQVLYTANLEAAGKTESLRKNHRNEMKAVYRERDASYRKILTGDQYQQYLKDREQRAQAANAHGRKHPGSRHR